jgi:hypothetical protein
VSYIERVLVLDPEDMTAHSFLWALTQSAEASAVAVDAYRRLAISGDIKAAQKLAALTGEGQLAARGDPMYAERIYDDMAEKFESKLVGHLGYRGPWDLRDMVTNIIDNSSGNIASASGYSGADNLKPHSLNDAASSSTSNDSGDNISSSAIIHENVTNVIISNEGSLSPPVPDQGSSTSRNDTKDSDITTANCKYKPMGQWRILDLGCGSGLVGRVFSLFTGKGRPGEEVSATSGEHMNSLYVL